MFAIYLALKVSAAVKPLVLATASVVLAKNFQFPDPVV
jgi:hypothetical protein